MDLSFVNLGFSNGFRLDFSFDEIANRVAPSVTIFRTFQTFGPLGTPNIDNITEEENKLENVIKYAGVTEFFKPRYRAERLLLSVSDLFCVFLSQQKSRGQEQPQGARG